jgi:hypothetical protein
LTGFSATCATWGRDTFGRFAVTATDIRAEPPGPVTEPFTAIGIRDATIRDQNGPTVAVFNRRTALRTEVCPWVANLSMEEPHEPVDRRFEHTRRHWLLEQNISACCDREVSIASSRYGAQHDDRQGRRPWIIAQSTRPLVTASHPGDLEIGHDDVNVLCGGDAMGSGEGPRFDRPVT